MSLTIRTVLEPHGPATAIELDEAQVEQLGGGRRAAVVVSIGGRTARLRLASMGGRYLIGISKANRAALGVEIGDEVEATVALDDAPREVEVPDDLAAALAAVDGARAAFDRLPYTHRKEHVNAILEAKKPETRERRIAAAVAKVSG
ncbi:YdeI/OmpD-associated family protein [Leucobacter ruminantium]|uniref:DUF1905 domain-containing protein n=1 Tax=Leucobacter ruminantium TaxID=1289170 RepID=A0A939RTE4_9MICO|nr:YdeI/OmpD-associated family protein [Leucobacter ruminantium]MBO1804140.1 DUF1905 domain-containing protein [Leucobacter ruminantium]